MARLTGSFSRLVSVIFRKDSQDITLRPNQGTTYTSSQDIQLPPGNLAHVLTSATSSQTLTNKTISGAANTLSNIALSSLSSLATNRALQSDGSGVISASSVTSTQLGYLSDVTSAIQAQLDGKLSLSGGTMTGAINFGGFTGTNLGAPSSANDAATKTYVDTLVSNQLAGITWKAVVRAATTASITLSGEQTIDGVAVLTGNRVLVKNQSTQSENGVYIVDSGSWSRATDFDAVSPLDEINGAVVPVLSGTVNANTAWQETATVVTVGSSNIVFTNFPLGTVYTGGNGITVTGSSIAVNHDGDGLQFNGVQLSLELDGSTLSKSSSGLKVASGGITNTEINASAGIDASKIGTGSVSNTEFGYLDGVTSAIQTQLNSKVTSAATDWVTGDGTTKAFTHSLGTKDIWVTVRDKSDDQLIFVDTITATSTSVVTLTSSEAPGASGWRVIVHA